MGVVISGSGQTPEMVDRAFRAAARQRFTAAIVATEGEIRARAPWRTGHLRRSITHYISVSAAALFGVVGTTTMYAPFLEFGTGLYGPRNRRIVPVRAKALRWAAGGSASSFSGGSRQQGSAGPGFRLSGQQRSGAAGAGAQYAYARSVRGIHPRHFFADGVLISRGRVLGQLRMIASDAQRILATGRPGASAGHIGSLAQVAIMSSPAGLPVGGGF